MKNPGRAKPQIGRQGAESSIAKWYNVEDDTAGMQDVEMYTPDKCHFGTIIAEGLNSWNEVSQYELL